MPEHQEDMARVIRTLRWKAARWEDLAKVSLRFVYSEEDVADPGIRARIASGKETRGRRTQDGTYTVYVPHIARSRVDVDMLIMNEIVSSSGIDGIVGKEGTDTFLSDLWGRLPESDKSAFLPRVARTEDPSDDRLAAAREYVADAADRLISHTEDRDTAIARWNFVMASFRSANGDLAGKLGMEHRDFSRLMGGAVRARSRSIRRQVPQMSRKQNNQK